MKYAFYFILELQFIKGIIRKKRIPIKNLRIESNFLFIILNNEYSGENEFGVIKLFYKYFRIMFLIYKIT